MCTYPCDNRASTHSATSLDRTAWQYNGTSSNPAILFDYYSLAQIGPFTPQPPFWIDWKRRSVNLHIGPNDATISNPDLTCVEDGAISSNRDILTDMDIVAVVAGERSFYYNVIAHVS
jgi:hypothetical protein